jgi:hypothetical protein
MNLPTNYDTVGKTYNALTRTQSAFVRFLYDAGFTTKDDVVFNRSYLTTLANSHGVTWPPAWIVKDTTRCTKRGYYAVPELSDYIIEQAALGIIDGIGSEDTFIEDDPQADTDAQVAEELSSTVVVI